MKNRNIIIIFSILILFSISVLGLAHYERETNHPRLHKTFKGTIILYNQADDDVTFVLDAFNSEHNIEFVINDETFWYGTEIEKKIKNCEIGIEVVVETEYYQGSLENEPYGVYPVLEFSTLKK